jgi:hypothetical protein
MGSAPTAVQGPAFPPGLASDLDDRCLGVRPEVNLDKLFTSRDFEKPDGRDRADALLCITESCDEDGLPQTAGIRASLERAELKLRFNLN